MAEKTKAAIPDRQCNNSKLKDPQHTRRLAGGQSQSAPVITGTAPLARLDFISLFSKQSSKLNWGMSKSSRTPWGGAALAYTPEQTCLGYTNFSALRKSPPIRRYPDSGYQPFGSMPRCCNSLRIIRFIHAASDSSPSCCCAFSIISLSSGSRRNWNGGLPRLSFLCVDTLSTPDVVCLCVMTHYIRNAKKATPQSAATQLGRLTKPLSEVTAMAFIKSTQTRPKFQYRFLALSATELNIISIIAATEREAREQSPAGCVMVFAGRLPAQEVHHA